MAKQWSSRVLLQVSTVVMTVFIACALSKLDTDCEANLSKSLDTAQNLNHFFTRVTNIKKVDRVIDGNGNKIVIEFMYKQGSVMQIITCKKLKEKKESYIDVHVLDYSSRWLSSFNYVDLPDLHENTYYLPSEDNAATYMHLSWYPTPGHLFITEKLTGCDIWIADSVDLDRSTGPLIVHVNANKAYDKFIRSKTVEELKTFLTHKRKLANEALDFFNRNLNNEYKFYCRISIDLIKSIDLLNLASLSRSKKKEMKKEIENFWKEDRADYRCSEKYWPSSKEKYKGFALFYGTYYDEGSGLMDRGKWDFRFRIGDLIKKVDYSE